MEETVNERIRLVMKHFGYRSVRAFATRIGIAPTSLNDVIRNGAEPKFSTLYKILTAEPTLSAEWLLRGNGKMTFSEENVPDDLLHSFAEHLDQLEKDVEEAKGQLEEMKEKLLTTLGENEYLREHIAKKEKNVKGAG